MWFITMSWLETTVVDARERRLVFLGHEENACAEEGLMIPAAKGGIDYRDGSSVNGAVIGAM